ncbi:MAG: shikimate kinase [Chthonomonadales bacterium]
MRQADPIGKVLPDAPQGPGRSDPPNLVLIGFMATGKSSIGRRCARVLGFRFYDSDQEVVRMAGKPIPEIFAEEGEAAFRSLEAAAIRRLACLRRIVLATGGGAALNAVNVARMRRRGVVVLLQADPQEILRRARHGAGRPLLEGAADPLERICELLHRRRDAYTAAAHAVVDTTGLDLAGAVERVLDAYRACGGVAVGEPGEQTQ